jgi:inosine/xanthosine triphosphate pyrophosphatase family protein
LPGEITLEKINQGFGYDPIFRPEGHIKKLCTIIELKNETVPEGRQQNNY